MITQEVLIGVSGTAQTPGEEDDTVRLVTTGVLSGESDDWTLRYEETQPDGTAHTITLLLKAGEVTMLRDGPYATGMVFRKGQRFEGSYQTPFGEMDIGIYATQVYYDVDTETRRGTVRLNYQLDVQGNFSAMHELTVQFAPKHDRI